MICYGRQKVSSHLSDVLSCIHNLPKDWISNIRPCSPRVLFYFESSPVVFQNPDNAINIKKLEHSLEDQIYHVLRKNRIVTNIRYDICNLIKKKRYQSKKILKLRYTLLLVPTLCLRYQLIRSLFMFMLEGQNRMICWVTWQAS